MRRALTLTGAVVAASQLVTLPAQASCGVAPPIRKALRQAPAVFVGEVVALTNARRWATVEVTDVWKGRVGSKVEVRGGPPDPRGPTSAVSTVDRYYEVGETYLFFPFRGRRGSFTDNACSNTTPYRARLDRFRPPGAAASSPTPSTAPSPADSEADDEDDERLAWPWWVTGVAVAGGGMVWVLRGGGERA
ncbi:MAG: hypothetical protein M3273_03605 [Actinomycetota bacterium]|nr:hypothetical protein [Actinomycetota bacterium]